MPGTPYFLQIDSIPGGSREKGHEGWIPIQKADIPNLFKLDNHFHFYGLQDKSMPLLMMRNADGIHLGSVTIDQMSDPRSQPRLFTLKDVTVTSFELADDGFKFTLNAATVVVWASPKPWISEPFRIGDE